jgi:phage tail-like protein
MSARQDPLMGFNFAVSLVNSQPTLGGALGGLVVAVSGPAATAGFSEVSGLEATMDIESYDAGGLNGGSLRLPGRIKWANLVLKRGVLAKVMPGDPSDFWTWLQTFLDGNGVRKDGTISLLDESGSPGLVWSWSRGLPVKWTGAAMNAQQSQVAIEHLEIAHEGLTLTSNLGSIGAAIVGVANALL